MTTRFQMPEAWREHDKKVRAYSWSNRLLGWAQKGVGIALLVYLLSSHRLLHLQWSLEERFSNSFVVWLVFFAVVGLAWKFIALPFEMSHHWVERRFGLSKQSYASWFKDVAKGVLLGGVLGTFALALLFISVTFFGPKWWVAGWLLLFLFSILLAQLAPVVLIPIFMKLNPMEDGELKSRLLALCKRFGVEVKDVYHLGMGEKTEKGNAAFMGLGSTKRIVIGDTLYKKYPAEEVEAVFAHELGHQVHNDMWKGVGVSAVILFLTFWLSDSVCQTYIFPYFLTSIDSALGLFLFFIVMGVVQTPFGIVQAMYSRSRERAADSFAVDKIGVGEPLADCLEKLTYQNFGYFRPLAVIEFLYYSHPAPWRRIHRLRG